MLIFVESKKLLQHAIWWRGEKFVQESDNKAIPHIYEAGGTPLLQPLVSV